jgi:adenylate kinase
MGLRIIMLGAPGAGKGTQAKRISDRFGLPHISTGDIFRAHLRQGTALGLEVKAYLDAGKLVPDALTCKILAERIDEADCTKGYVLDGFPRSIPQAEELERVLAGKGQKLDMAIDVAVADAIIVQRLTARRSCPKCGAVYNLTTQPPKTAGKCDVEGCGGDLIQRVDDCEETINERLRVYHETTEPIIAFYQERGILKSVAGDVLGPDDIFVKVEAIVVEAESCAS